MYRFTALGLVAGFEEALAWAEVSVEAEALAVVEVGGVIGSRTRIAFN